MVINTVFVSSCGAERVEESATTIVKVSVAALPEIVPAIIPVWAPMVNPCNEELLVKVNVSVEVSLLMVNGTKFDTT